MFYRALTDKQTLRVRRARPVIALAAVAFAIGAIVGANQRASSADALAARFVAAWAQRRLRGDVRRDRRRLATRAVGRRIRLGLPRGDAHGDGDEPARGGQARGARGRLVAVPVRVRTRLFGTLSLNVRVTDRQRRRRRRDGRLVALARVPRRARRRDAHRRTTLPRARDAARARRLRAGRRRRPTGAGTRSSPLGESASAVVGEVGPIPSSRRVALEAEASHRRDRRHERPGARARRAAARHARRRAARRQQRVLASAAPHAAHAVRTSVSPAVQQRRGGSARRSQLGGVVALQPSTGQILAVAGIGLDSVQPPGSTFKMITLTGRCSTPTSRRRTATFPYATYATLDGVKLSNANGEECGGSLELAFAVSCNSVFAPLGVKLGAPRLVAMAERFGFNHPPGHRQAPPRARCRRPRRIQGELDVGSTAIGQGQVQASRCRWRSSRPRSPTAGAARGRRSRSTASRAGARA